MKQTLEEAAKQELMSSYAIVVEGELVYQRQAMLNMFKKGAEWQSKQSMWINVKELLNKELSFEEMNELLNELMNFSCNVPEDSSEIFRVFDEKGDICDFRKYIGMQALNTLSGILLLKEKIDEERGEWRGRYEIQRSIKQALGID